MRSVNIDQTLRSDIASYKLRCAYRCDDAVIAYDDITTRDIITLYPGQLALAAAIINLREKMGTSLVNRTAGSVPEKSAMFSVNYRGGAVFITPGHRATTGAPS